MYKTRSRGGFFSWGHNGRGKLGLNTADIPDNHKTPRGVCLPTQVNGLGSLVVSDISAGGWGFLLLDIEGSVYGIGSISDKGRSPYVPGRPGYGHVNLPPIRNPRGAGMFPFRIGGVLHRDHRDVPPADGPPPPAPVTRPTQPTSTGTSGMYGGGQPQPQTELAEPVNPLGHGIGPAVPPRTSAQVDTLMNYADGESGNNNKKPTMEDIRGNWLLKFPEDQKPKVIAISSGRARALALDEDNKIWQWDQTYYREAARLQFSFGDKTIHKISGGWEKAAAIVDGEGIIVWDGVSLTNAAPVRPVQHVTVPHTNFVDDRQVVDVAIGRDSLVFLNKKGDAYAVDMSNIEKGPVLLETYMTKLKLSNWKVEPKFVKVTGNLSCFSLISDREDVFLTPSGAVLNATSEPLIVPELQQKGCLSVVAGDHHFMALMKGGKILSWGCESGSCGDLGQGLAEAVLKLDGASERGNDLMLSKPTEIKIEGKALAIAAGGWQSAAIITTDKVDEDDS